MQRFRNLFQQIENSEICSNTKNILRQILDEVSDHENRISKLEEDLEVEDIQVDPWERRGDDL